MKLTVDRRVNHGSRRWPDELILNLRIEGDDRAFGDHKPREELQANVNKAVNEWIKAVPTAATKVPCGMWIEDGCLLSEETELYEFKFRIPIPELRQLVHKMTEEGVWWMNGTTEVWHVEKDVFQGGA